MSNPTVDKITYRVTFRDVGRSNKSWAQVLKQTPTEAILARLVRKSGALASRDINCVFDEDLEYGTIIVGGYRCVGAFRIEALKINSDPFDATHVALAFAGLE